MKTRRSALSRIFHLSLGLAGAAFIVVAIRRSTTGGWRAVVPSAPRFLLAFGLLLAGVFVAGAGWRALLAPTGRVPGLQRGFYVSLLAKYIPGGIWQPIGQVSLATRAGISRRRAMVALPVHSLVLLVSGSVLAPGAAVSASNAPLPLRVLLAAGPLTICLLHRQWMRAALRVAKRFVSWFPSIDDLPSQRRILIAFVWSLVAMGLTALGFAVLLDRELTAAFGFAAAWTVGYAVLPVPSGLGIREAVLVGLLSAPTAAVLGASVAHRIASMLAEAALAGASAIVSIVGPSRTESGAAVAPGARPQRDRGEPSSTGLV